MDRDRHTDRGACGKWAIGCNVGIISITLYYSSEVVATVGNLFSKENRGIEDFVTKHLT